MAEPTITDLFERACRHVAGGRPQAALTVYDRVLKRSGDVADRESAHWASGELLVNMGRMDEAVEHLEEAVRLNASEPAYFRLLGEAHAASDDFEEAREAFQRAVELAPRDAEAHRLLGASLIRLDRREDAERVLARAVFLDRGHLRARVDLAVLLASMGRHEAALDLARSAYRADPEASTLRETLRVLELAHRAATGAMFPKTPVPGG